ncbi:MAG: glycolate oxidase subunit GlcE [Alphaproteobacteria bacterium]
MATTLKPEDADQVREAVAWASAQETPLEVAGHGSKRGLGRPVVADYRLDVSGVSGVKDYQPAELLLVVRPGTPLPEMEALLNDHDQHLAFEPADYGPLWGEVPGGATVGGVIACNLSGPRRVKAGAARDHFLGVAAVTGRGEAIKAGGRVVKNVTGYDLCKLLAGSYGTLAVMTEVTVKVLPAPEQTRTNLLFGCDDEAGIQALGEAMQSPHEVSGAAHLPAPVAARSGVSEVKAAGAAVTAVRVEGPGSSVRERCRALHETLAAHRPVGELDTPDSLAFWREVRDVHPFAGNDERVVWRVSLPPGAAAAAVARIRDGAEAEAFYDWAGSLVWLALAKGEHGGEGLVRGALAECGGHALIVRGDAGLRASVPVFQPQSPALQALTARVKEGFDPRGILNPGRMYAELWAAARDRKGAGSDPGGR